MKFRSSIHLQSEKTITLIAFEIRQNIFYKFIYNYSFIRVNIMILDDCTVGFCVIVANRRGSLVNVAIIVWKS